MPTEDVEIGEFLVVCLAGYELENVGVVHPENAHVGAAPDSPCLTASVAALKAFSDETGPDATPQWERTISFLGRNLLKLKPVPPPDWWIKAAYFNESKMLTILSSTGNTKHADNCCKSPGVHECWEFGMNSPLTMW